MKKKSELHSILSGKWEDGTRPKDIYDRCIRTTPGTYVDNIIDGLSCGDRRIENGCSELASLMSAEYPELLYPHVSLFIANINAKEKMIRWEAVCTLGHLAAVDDARLIVPFIPRIIVHLRDKSIVLAGHALATLSKMALAYPDRARDIFSALIEAADAFPGNRIGFVIEAMGPLIALESLNAAIEKFVFPYTKSPVKVVARKATKVLKNL